MTTSLLQAPEQILLVLEEIRRPGLARWLERLGLYAGGTLVRHAQEICYFPVRIRSRSGDVVVPAGLGTRVFVHVESGERKPLVEMERGERGHVEASSCGMGCASAMARLGIGEEEEITFIRSLPHMDYVTVIDQKFRTRITEGEAARLWGTTADGVETQFYFAPRNQRFTVTEILGGRRVQEHLETHWVRCGSSLVLETIEQAKELHAPGREPVVISTPDGLRLYLDQEQARHIRVRPA
ncbi:MAG: hypothetical protein ACOX5Z_09645 [Desulfobulbus sp.]